MRTQRNTLLAGIAAVALIAGAGAASAQQTGNEEHGATQPHAASQQMNKGGATMRQNLGAQNGTAGKMDRNAAEENKTGAKMQQNAAEENKAGGKMDRNAAEEKSASGKMGQTTEEQSHRNMTQHSAQSPRRNQHTMAGREDNRRQTSARERERFGSHQTAAQRNERNGQATAERERNGLKGLQGNARVNVQLNDEQRTRIRETVIDARGAPRIDHVDFNIAVGTVVPRTGVRFVPVPETLVAIEPAWRGYDYFVYEQELVLIDPATMTIVAVITV